MRDQYKFTHDQMIQLATDWLSIVYAEKKDVSKADFMRYILAELSKKIEFGTITFKGELKS